MPKLSKPDIKPFWESGDGRAVVWLGDCREVMRQFAVGTFDTILTDPPYGLEFMGKEWDKLGATTGGKERWIGADGRSIPSGRVCYGKSAASMQSWHQEWTVEALHVAKPGASLLAFGGTRTHHRLICAIEDAGWEIRDCLMWLYGSGFPKSLDIGKAIDAVACRADLTERLGRSPTRDEFKAAWATWRKVVGKSAITSPRTTEARAGFARIGDTGDYSRLHTDITRPTAVAAQEWEGYGSALKPAWEPIVVAMKPLDGTFAENAVKHGVAGLHIDDARIVVHPDDPVKDAVWTARPSAFRDGTQGFVTSNKDGQRIVPEATIEKGRWPANLVLDEEAAWMLDQQSGNSSGKTVVTKRSATKDIDGVQYGGGYSGQDRVMIGYEDFGGASRFFYTSKADSGERHAAGRNQHPTVKPLDLMVWLAKLTSTPTGGVVLDPFMGSGTTGVACLQVGRRFVGIEQDRESCEVAVKRLQKACAYRFHSTKHHRRLNAKINKKLKGSK